MKATRDAAYILLSFAFLSFLLFFLLLLFIFLFSILLFALLFLLQHTKLQSDIYSVHIRISGIC